MISRPTVRASRCLALALPLCFLALMGAMTARPTTVYAAGTMIALDVDPSTGGVQKNASVPQGRDFSIDVVAADASPMGAFEFEVTYDPTVLDLERWSLGPFLGSTGRNPVCTPQITQRAIRIGCVTWGLTPPGPSGTGVLATIVFSHILTGTVCPVMIDAGAATVDGDPIPVTRQSGCITVVADAPVPIPSPTATPRPPLPPPPTATQPLPAQPIATLPPTEPSATYTSTPAVAAVATQSPPTAAPPAQAATSVAAADATSPVGQRANSQSSRSGDRVTTQGTADDEQPGVGGSSVDEVGGSFSTTGASGEGGPARGGAIPTTDPTDQSDPSPTPRSGVSHPGGSAAPPAQAADPSGEARGTSWTPIVMVLVGLAFALIGGAVYWRRRRI